MLAVLVALLAVQPDFGSMRVKQLKAVLTERGVTCEGCLEKQEFVDRCVETWNLPVVQPKPSPSPKPPKSTTLRAWLRRANRNIILPCMRNSTATFADTGATAALAAQPNCWHEYFQFLSDEGLPDFDSPGLEQIVDGGMDSLLKMATPEMLAAAGLDGMGDMLGGLGGQGAIADMLREYQAGVKSSDPRMELTGHLTTALAIVDALRLALGDDAFETRTAPVTVDLIGWAFHWEDSATDGSREVPRWADVEGMTAYHMGEMRGAVLRRLLPRVRALTIRGYGPEVPRVPPTSMRDDGWLTLELHPGLYSPTQPPPTATLIENSGLMDGYWPSEGGCLSEHGVRDPQAGVRMVAAASGSWVKQRVPLACMWRDTIEALRDDGRMVYVTSYQSHEHLRTLRLLRSASVEVLHAYPFGFREENHQLLESTFDLLEPQKNTRGWAQLGSSSPNINVNLALWRYRVETLGWERTVAAQTRNCHVMVFQGAAAIATPLKSIVEIQNDLVHEICEGAKCLPSKVKARVMEMAQCA